MIEPSAAVPVFLIRNVVGVGRDRKSLVLSGRSEGDHAEFSVRELVHRVVRGILDRRGGREIERFGSFVRYLKLEKGGGETRILGILRDEGIVSRHPDAHGRVGIVKFERRDRKLPGEFAASEVREALHRAVCETESEVHSGLPGEILVNIAADDARVGGFSGLGGLDGEMRTAVDRAFVCLSVDFPVDQASVSGKAYRPGADSAERKGNFVCVMSFEFGAFHLFLLEII